MTPTISSALYVCAHEYHEGLSVSLSKSSEGRGDSIGGEPPVESADPNKVERV